MSRSKKISLGFVVVDLKTGEKLSPVFARRAPAREIAVGLYKLGTVSGVQQLVDYVAADASAEEIATLRAEAGVRS
jgi:hypothetical protein